MKLYKCLTIKDLLHLEDIDPIFIDKIDTIFCRRFTKLLSFIMYDVINNNKDVYILKQNTSPHFFMKEINKYDIIGLRGINMFKDLDLVMHNHAYIMMCESNFQNVTHSRGVFSFATLKRSTERINNYESMISKDNLYCIDYYPRMYYLYRMTIEEYISFLQVVDDLIFFILRNKIRCFFKVIHLDMNTYISFTTTTMIESRTEMYSNTSIMKAKIHYKHNEKNNDGYYYFYLNKEKFDKYYIDGKLTMDNKQAVGLYKYLEHAVVYNKGKYFFVIKYLHKNPKIKFSTKQLDLSTAQFLFYRPYKDFHLPKKIIINESSSC